ncbi:MAG: PHP domain-containing protein [Myxococcota bacterium]
MSERYDFHTHTVASDGSLTPTELVRAAAANGVTGFALTDHDTIDGIAEAQAEASRLGIELIPGIEISVNEQDGARSLHVLGLGLSPEHPLLRTRLGHARHERRTRAARMVARLQEAGVAIELADVEAIAAGGSVGRPHLARALVDLGVCRDADEAFVKYLRRGRPGYEPYAAFSAREAIELVHGAGGVAVLAHPPLSGGVDAPGGIEAFVERLLPDGLDGLEIWHPGHKPGQIRRLRRLAREHDLLETGGSDFHGEDRPGIEIGRGRAGGLRIGRPVYDAFRARLDARRAARELTLSGPESNLGRPS